MENIYPATVADLNRIEWNNEPVLTSAQLAEKYQCLPTHIKQNFNNNRDRFIEGKHFIKLVGEDLRTFKREVENFDLAPNANSLYLWTKRGAARHSKMLGTDVAWEVFELLEDTYFNKAVEKEVPTINDFERGKELAKIVPFTKDAFKQDKLICKAANLILGYNFLDEPSPKPQQLNLFFPAE